VGQSVNRKADGVAKQPTVTKERLLEATVTTVSRYGLRKATLEDIGKAVGVSKAAVLYHYHSKEELVATVISKEYDRFFAVLREAIEKESTAETRLHAFAFMRFQYIVERIASYGALTKEILESVMPLVREVIARNREQELSLLRGILAEGMASGELAPGDPDLIAMASMAGLTGLYDAFILYDRGDRIADGLEQLFQLLMNGLRRRP
jgi:AcrR family transcriptional regulator